ncbi:hypothetical protein CN072_22350 [Sinorhizobium meliloti]|uniref:hypothetical protein n=2 Tax=Rhizobium meliloti TaxID=382 RepID=UPI000FD4DCDE|nr:hypothetical protein [Sinorhizobium meliloti]RVG92096.1 hypothetical protein CN218_18620 [Sinorhizobium meliloti]RVP82058.1 hypothetical protein CN072_22350 [Sinorhizobium meliloti]
MSSRKFSMISPAVFQSERYLSCGSDARELFFYCLAGPHQTMIGCFRAPELYIAADLRWQPEQIKAGLCELVDAGLIDHDPKTHEIMVERWFNHCQITTEKHMQGARRLIGEVNSDHIRDKLEEAFLAFEEARDRGRASASRAADSPDRLTNTAYLSGRR